MNQKERRIIVGISGASGSIFGIRTLQLLHELHIQTHLILTEPAKLCLEKETDWNVDDVIKLADATYPAENIGAIIASGSFQADGMIVVPCSIKSLSGIANGYEDNLLIRAGNVTLKEGRNLLLAVRESPLHRGHLRLMALAIESGAIIFPLIPIFYDHPKTIEDLTTSTVGRMLDRIGIENKYYPCWNGLGSE